MALYRVVFSLLGLSVVQCLASTEVPVFLWGNLNKASIKNNPLTKVTTDEFDNVLSEELNPDAFTVIFIEETLSVEDFSSKNTHGESSFPYLQDNLSKAVYIPSVENALRVLNRLADPEKEDHVKLTENSLSADIKHEGVKYLFINMKDAQEGESRADMLRRHNDFMEDMFTKLQKKHGEVIGIYTAHYPSWTMPEAHTRTRRQAETQNHDYTFDRLRLYVSQIRLLKGDELINLGQVTGNSTNFNATDRVLNTTLNFNSENLTLDFTTKGGYWFFDMVTFVNGSMTEYLFPENEIYAVNGFSYRCGQNVTFTTFVNDTNKYTVTFQDLKIQAFFEDTPKREFGDSFNCVGFFTAPIWASLMVVFILLSITFYGIMMMMDIRTMDRFDDPKGKTITINAGE